MSEPRVPISLEELDRLLAGELPAADAQTLRDRLAHDARLTSIYDGLHDGVYTLGDGDDSLQARGERRLVAVLQSQTLSRPRVHGRSRPLFRLGVSVALAVVAVIGVIGRIAFRRNGQAPHVYATSAEQRATLRLPDGSNVLLAPKTTLAVLPGFSVDHRTMMLTGEAHFDVHPGSRLPVIIHAGPVTTRVLGTTFDVVYRDSLSPVQIAVFNGKVAVNTTHRRPVILAAGTVGEAYDSTVRVTTHADLSSYQDWTDGRLVFRDAPVPELLARVGQWYGVELHLADSTLASRHVTVVFDRRPIEDVLAVLRGVLHVTMTFRGNVVLLYPAREATRDTISVQHQRASLSLITGVGR